MNPYETDKLLSEYLLFHYGTPDETLTGHDGLRGALGYPVRCITECMDYGRLPAQARALDLGCAVGRSTFELARSCVEVIGIDFSHRFVEAAETLRYGGRIAYERADEGDLTTSLHALAPPGVDQARLRFEQGDAMHLREGLGTFDVVLMANLIDRLVEPRRCLDQLGHLVRPGGQLIITSPYTWLESFTPREHWLGGRVQDGAHVATLDGLQSALGQDFTLRDTRELPFLIREHARKYQWSVAQATRWERKS